MPAELEAVDRLLDDERFFAPYRRFFHATLGRPSIPIETYLRLMFLKYRYRLGFEPLCREVADSISWSRFARIPLGGKVPHPTTLMKITTRCGEHGDQRTERGAVGQGGRGQGAQDEPGAGGHDGGRGERGVSVGLVAARQGHQPDGIHGEEAAGSRLRDPHPGRGPDPLGAQAGAVDQREPATPQRRQARRSKADQRRARSPRRPGRTRRRPGGAQRPTPATRRRAKTRPAGLVRSSTGSNSSPSGSAKVAEQMPPTARRHHPRRCDPRRVAA